MRPASPFGSRVAYEAIRLGGGLIGVPYFRPRVEGRRHVIGPDPFIVACNHATLLDWAGLAFFVPRPVRFLMTRTYFDRPALRWFCRMGGAIPVTPGRIEPSALRLALGALDRGEAVGIFPEGRLSMNASTSVAYRGVAALAMHARVPVVPATIRGAAEAFPATARIPRPRRVTVVFGAAMAAPAASSSPAVQADFTRRLMHRIAELGSVSEPPSGRFVLHEIERCPPSP